MGKLKKIGIAFFSIMILLIAFSEITDYFESESTGIEKFKAKSHEEMNYSELSLIAVQYDYKDLMRNIDDYSGKIIFVEGEVDNIQYDIGMLNFCVDKKGYCSLSDDFIFVKVNGIDNWLEDDKLSGYVEVVDLGKVYSSNMFTGGEMVESGDYAPRVKEMQLRCSNC
jgi:hypothetical protein